MSELDPMGRTLHARPPSAADLFPVEPPYAVDGRIPYERLTNRQQLRLGSWLIRHGIEPDRVDAGSLVERDGGEWRIGVRRPDGGYVIVRRAERRRPVSVWLGDGREWLSLDRYITGDGLTLEVPDAERDERDRTWWGGSPLVQHWRDAGVRDRMIYGGHPSAPALGLDLDDERTGGRAVPCQTWSAAGRYPEGRPASATGAHQERGQGW